MTTKLDTTLAAFQDNITEFAIGKALRNVEAWHKDLAQMEDPKFEKVVADLEKLKGELEKDKVNGKTLGKLLSKLGKEVAAVSKELTSATGEKLHVLSEYLTQTGGELTTEESAAKETASK
ncbi:hypothetical protein [Candidatus Cyanaurora vandensis]|uniref:hypothetical protein n=1 Tax=Candidatus Cyanaurora vandensis TaxID=2714958 RepID=UPI00257B4382|nr:hypothetical protein [Candidatus Cyanaurora vandensis]